MRDGRNEGGFERFARSPLSLRRFDKMPIVLVHITVCSGSQHWLRAASLPSLSYSRNRQFLDFASSCHLASPFRRFDFSSMALSCSCYEVTSSSSLRSYRGPFQREMARNSDSSLSFLSLTRKFNLEVSTIECRSGSLRTRLNSVYSSPAPSQSIPAN